MKSINKRREAGFTLIELVMVIVILGILAAVAIPRFINLSTQAEQAAEDGVVGALRSAVYVYSVNQMATAGTASYPANPFDELDLKPNGFDSAEGSGVTTNGSWSFSSSNSYVKHVRNNGDDYFWSYSSGSGVIGNRSATAP